MGSMYKRTFNCKENLQMDVKCIAVSYTLFSCGHVSLYAQLCSPQNTMELTWLISISCVRLCQGPGWPRKNKTSAQAGKFQTPKMMIGDIGERQISIESGLRTLISWNNKQARETLHWRIFSGCVMVCRVTETATFEESRPPLIY